jgi:hypothetical protein
MVMRTTEEIKLRFGERIVNLFTGRSLGEAFPHRFLPGAKSGSNHRD